MWGVDLYCVVFKFIEVGGKVVQGNSIVVLFFVVFYILVCLYWGKMFFVLVVLLLVVVVGQKIVCLIVQMQCKVVYLLFMGVKDCLQVVIDVLLSDFNFGQWLVDFVNIQCVDYLFV